MKVIEKCNHHPRYRAILRPRANCDACWEFYDLKHSDEEFQVPQGDGTVLTYNSNSSLLGFDQSLH